jgi:hypothetical protein
MYCQEITDIPRWRANAVRYMNSITDSRRRTHAIVILV